MTTATTTTIESILHADARLNGYRIERYFLAQHANRLLGMLHQLGLPAPNAVLFTCWFEVGPPDRQQKREELCLGLYWPALGGDYKDRMVRIRPGGLASYVLQDKEELVETREERELLTVLFALHHPTSTRLLSCLPPSGRP
jgi:hypothetical protein